MQHCSWHQCRGVRSQSTVWCNMHASPSMSELDLRFVSGRLCQESVVRGSLYGLLHTNLWVHAHWEVLKTLSPDFLEVLWDYSGYSVHVSIARCSTSFLNTFRSWSHHLEQTVFVNNCSHRYTFRNWTWRPWQYRGRQVCELKPLPIQLQAFLLGSTQSIWYCLEENGVVVCSLFNLPVRLTWSVFLHYLGAACC